MLPGFGPSGVLDTFYMLEDTEAPARKYRGQAWFETRRKNDRRRSTKPDGISGEGRLSEGVLCIRRKCV